VLHELEGFLLLVTEFEELINVKLTKWLMCPIFSDVAQNLLLPGKHVLVLEWILWNERLFQLIVKVRVCVFKHDRVIVDNLKVLNEFSDFNRRGLLVKIRDNIKLTILIFVDDSLLTRFSDTRYLEFFSFHNQRINYFLVC
jgi:hypothetical protein